MFADDSAAVIARIPKQLRRFRVVTLRTKPSAKPEALLIVVFVIVALVLLAVIRLGAEIREDGTSSFDTWLILALRQPRNLGVPIGPAWLRPVVVDITALGGVTALSLLVTIASGYMVIAKRYRDAMLLATATISSVFVGLALKFSFARARPQLVPHLVDIGSSSYPSGHAENSAVIFLTLAATLARAEPVLRVRVYLLLVAIVLTLLIGCSRVYVGVHWPTDVIAGWAIGGGWALLWWAIASKVRTH